MVLVDYLVDRAKSTRKALAIAFIDLEKAFDKVPRAKLFALLLQQYGICPSLVEMVRQMYHGLQGQVKGHNTAFDWTMGVKQGCPASPLLFGLFFDRVVPSIAQALPPDTDSETTLWVAYLALQAALYADDLVLLAPSAVGLQT